MHFLDIAKERYTTKKYDAAGKLTEEQVAALKEILRLSPSSINSQPWKFSFINSEPLKSQLAAVSFFNESKINNASHLVVFSVFDDVALFEQHIQANLPEGSVGYYQKFIKPLPEQEIKSWMQHQVYLSLGFFLAACASMGIDSTPMEGIQLDAYANILQQEGYKPLFAVALGKRDPEDANQPSLKPKLRLPMEQVITSL